MLPPPPTAIPGGFSTTLLGIAGDATGCSSPRGCCDVEMRMFSEISAVSILLMQPLSGFPFLVWPLSWCAHPSMIVCNHTFQLFESSSAKLFTLPRTHQDPLSLQEPFTCPQIPSFPLSRFILEDPSHSRVSCDAYKLSKEKQKMIPVSQVCLASLSFVCSCANYVAAP